MKTKQFILLGPPGVEVKAQATALANQWQIPHVSMGDLVREAIRQGSALGVAARPAVEAGDWVADDIVMKLIRKRFEQPDVVLKGWVMDGFPRILSQAQAFEDWWSGFGQPAATVVYLKAMMGILMNRLSTQSPGQPISAIRHRLEVHQAEVAPILDFYQSRSQITSLNGSLPFAEVTRALVKLGYDNTGAAQWIQDEADLNAWLAKEPRLVVDCMASWCGSCKQVTPLIDQLAAAYRDRVTVMKIDFDAHRQISKRFELKGIPAVMFFKHGERIETLTGVKSYAEYSAALTQLLD